MFGSTGYDAGFNGEKYFGRGSHLTLMRQGRNYSFSLTQNNFSPTYQTYNGLFPQVDGKTTDMEQVYTFLPNKKIVQTWGVFVRTDLIYNYDGIFKNLTIIPGFKLNMIGQTHINAGYYAINRELFRNVFFTSINRSSINVQTVPVKGVGISVDGEVGKFIYRTLMPVMGKGYTISSEVDLEPFSRLKTSFTWTIAKLNDLNDSTVFYNGNIVRNITSFQFTKRFFLRNIVQYNTFSKTFSVYPLLNYRFNAFTMFCAGMTQDLLNYNQGDYTFKTSGYQYFVKLQYLFSK
jgi:hypothetical protein